MAYFKIGENDYSMYVNELIITKSANYNAQTNAAGNTVVDYINQKRVIEVGIIPLEAEAMLALQADIDKFNVSISFQNPLTNALETGVNVIIPENGVEYYTIRADRTQFKAFKLKFIEL